MSKAYSLLEVPESSTEVSRWFIPAHQNGIAADPGTAFATAVQALSIGIRSTRKPLAPEPVTLPLSQILKTRDGYSVGSRGEITLVPNPVNERPGKLWSAMSGSQLVDSFLRRDPGGAFEKAPDRSVWLAAGEAAEAMKLDGADLRKMNDYLAVALLARAGFAGVKDSALPHPFPAPTRRSSNPVTIAKEKAKRKAGSHAVAA
jgi:hypothetical protein